jgi:hypothetical protein
MKKVGLIRLSIVVMSTLIIGLLIPFLKIHHFSPFNSGVSSVIGVLSLVWLIYSVVLWVAEGFKK